MKIPTVGHNNKIFQRNFGVVLQSTFPATETVWAENKKWLGCEKSHFLLFGQIKKMSLSQIVKNGPKTQFQLKMPFCYSTQKTKSHFFHKKITFCLMTMSKKSHVWPKLSFWPIIGNLTQWHFCDLARKQKVIFSQKNHFLFTEQHDLVVRKISSSTISKLLWKILLLRPTVGDFHLWLFWIPRGSPLTLR